MAKVEEQRPGKRRVDYVVEIEHHHHLDSATTSLLRELVAESGSSAKTLTRIERSIAAMQKQGTDIMSKISDTHTSVKEGFDASNLSLDNLATDMAALDAKITELQNSPGVVTPEDQALLDDLQAMAATLKAKTQAMADVHPDPAVDPAPSGRNR